MNADGSLDTGFYPNPDYLVDGIALQADGKILLGGEFSSIQPNEGTGIARRSVARVNTDGSLDMGFDPKANNAVVCVTLQADGKVLTGGSFTTLQPNGATSRV